MNRMSRKIVHIVGTGTIGEPLIALLASLHRSLGIDEVSFQPDIAALQNKAIIKGLIHKGAKLCVAPEQTDFFSGLGLKADYTPQAALERSAVIIDCSPPLEGMKNKVGTYSQYAWENKVFIAQANQIDFGKNYAFGINDEALIPHQDQFIRIVSCNTHTIATLIKTLAFDDSGNNRLEWGRFTIIRRASDISQEEGMIPAPRIERHTDPTYGSYHAADAASLFRSIGIELDVFTSVMQVNSQYHHIVHFDLRTDESITLQQILGRIEKNPYLAITNKTLTSLVFAFIRDIGYSGRILNQSIIVVPSLQIRKDNEIVGFSFAPQDGNSVLSSIAAALWALYPFSYREKLKHINNLVFDEV